MEKNPSPSRRAHGSGSGQRFAGQPTGSGGAAERPDLLELAQSGRVGAKSVSAEDDYLALQLQVAGVGEDVRVAAGVDVAAKDAFGSDELGQRTLDLLSSSLSAQTLKSYAGRLSQFAEFCHDSENISPLEATTATVVRYVAWIGERGHIAAKSLQPYLSAINTFFELHNLVPIAKDSLHLTSARRGLMLRQRRLDAAPLRVPLPADVANRFVTKAELIVSAPYPEYHLDFRALLASVVNFMFFARGLTGVSCRVRDVHVDTYNITLQVRYGHRRACVAAGGRRTRDEGVIWKGDPGDFYMKVIAKKFRGVWHYGVITGVVTEWVLEDYGGATQWRAVFEDGDIVDLLRSE
eukprot:jgi/Tetstr1/456002/TSEL_042780.t1